LISRDPNTGQIRFISDVNQNARSLTTAGVDIGLRGGFDTLVGRFGLLLDVTQLDYFNQTQPDGLRAFTIHGADTYDLGALPRWKANLVLTWQQRGWGAALAIRHAAGFRECGQPPPDSTSSGGVCYPASNLPARDVSSATVVDVRANYT